jgi:2-(3-amino-3-carboxypropyl)histidine synthase
MVLDFEKEKLIEELKKRKPKKVLVQLPEGVKQNALEIKEIFDNLKIEVIFSGETCWGGCAIAVFEAKEVEADLIVHFGHAEFIKVDFPVLYIEIKDNLDLEPLLKKSLESLKDFKKIGFSYSIQHRQDLDKIIGFYESNKKEIILSEKKGSVAYEGHVIGCQYAGLKAIQDKVDCFVILGNQFHSMGAVLAVNKPVILLDVYNNDLKFMEDIREKVLKQRAVSIERFKKAEKIGIIIETKLGQRFGSAEKLVKEIEDAGKKAIVITMNEITPDKLMNFYSIDAFVELACPRIALDDYLRYEKPILTFREALVGLGKMSWEDFIEKGVL